MRRAVVLATGGVGLAIVTRAAAFYGRTDGLAFALVILIGVGLVVGLVELTWRLGRAESLQRELATLPRPARLDAIEGASPPLSSMLRARMTATPTAAAPSLTPHLLGLLVMLGLLGTFLGLFETLRGAREALTASGGDVDVLRRGLVAPMTGLSRAFGLSAAGVSASATLGLAALVVRRAEGRFLAALSAYAAGPLQPLTAAGRSALALEAMARQGEALPHVAEALKDAVRRLDTLERSLRESHATTTMELASALTETARAVATSMTDATSTLSDRLATTTQSVATSMKDASATLSSGLATTTQSVTTSMKDASATFSSGLATTTQSVATSMKDATGALTAQLATAAHAVATSMKEAAGGVTAQLATTTDAVTASLTDALAALTAQLTATTDAVAASLTDTTGTLTAQLTATTDAMAASQSAAAAAATTAIEGATKSVTHAVTAATTVVARELSLSAERVPVVLRETLAGPVDLLVERLDAHSARSMGELSAQGAALSATVGTLAQQTATSLDALAASVRRGLEDGGARVEASLEATGRRLEEGLDGHVRAVAARLDDEGAQASARMESTARATAEAVVHMADGLVRALTSQSAQVEGALAETQARVGEAAALVRCGGADLSAVAEKFTEAVERYRETTDAFFVTLAGLDATAERAAREEAIAIVDAYVERTRDVFQETVSLQRELFGELHALRRSDKSSPTLARD